MFISLSYKIKSIVSTQLDRFKSILDSNYLKQIFDYINFIEITTNMKCTPAIETLFSALKIQNITI